MIFFAHRGDSRNYTENTADAFRSSLRKKFRALELDLITIADGTVVIFHDDTLGRLAGLNLRASELSLGQFRAYFPQLTTLDEFTELFSRADIIVNFEIKDSLATFRRAIGSIRKFRHPVVSSFMHEITESALRENFESAYLFDSESALLRKITGLKTKRLHLNKSIVLEGGATVDLLYDSEVYCYTVNDLQELRLLSGYPFVKGIFTDTLTPDSISRF